MAMGGVLLGMPGRWADEPIGPFFTTKVGGLPDWPLPKDAIAPHLLHCATCGSKLCLLSQLHAPRPSENILDRFLFIFGCVMPKCGSASRSWRVLRIQKIHDEDKSQTCIHGAASATATATASSCGVQNASCWEDFSEEDDMDLEELGRALFEAGTLASKTKKPQTNELNDAAAPASPCERKTVVDIDIDMPVVPCFFIDLVEEPSSGDLSSVCSNYASLSIKENAIVVGENASDDEDNSQNKETKEKELYEYDKSLAADRTYLKFKKRVDACPEQCFRYSYGGKPLLAAAAEIDPGRCRLCGGSRQFEMQLMPPLLYFLQEALEDDQRQLLENWDWMTLIVYSCSKSCTEEVEQEKSNGRGWTVAEEVVVAQYEESMPIQVGFFS